MKHDLTIVSFMPPNTTERMYKVRCSCGYETRHHYHAASAEHEAAQHKAAVRREDAG